MISLINLSLGEAGWIKGIKLGPLQITFTEGVSGGVHHEFAIRFLALEFSFTIRWWRKSDGR